jgi:hypothetical protein
MRRHRHLRLLPCLAVLIAGFAVGCSDDDGESGKDSASTTAETAPAEKPDRRPTRAQKSRRGSAKGDAARRRLSTAELAEERRALKREAAKDRKEDREFDRAFNETRFEKILAELPIRKPPLFVEQYITSGGSSTVYTAVAPKRFFCGRSAARRKAAVSAFYRDADRLFRRRGVEDFAMVVTPVTETIESLPALATGRDGKVSLTRRGRAKGPC